MISGRTTGLSSPVSNVPPTSSRPSSSWVATGATIPGRCTGVGSVTSRCPLTRSHGTSRSSPSRVGGSPVANTTAPGCDLPGGGVHRHHPVTAGGDAGGGHPGGHAGQRGGQPGYRAERVDPALVVDPGPGHGQRQPRHELGHLARIQPFHRRRLMRGQPARIRGQPDPVHVDQADPAGPGLLELVPLGQAGPGQVHERLRVAPFVDLRGEQAGRAAGRPGAQVASLDELHGAQPGLMAGRRDGHPGDPASDHQQIRMRLRDRAAPADQFATLGCGELVEPDSSLHGHDPIAAAPDGR